MDLTFISDFAIPVIVGICVCIGYIIKNMVTTDKINKYIPLIVGMLGVILNIWMNMSFTPQILLGGLVSGLASTGLYEAFRNVINKNKED